MVPLLRSVSISIPATKLRFHLDVDGCPRAETNTMPLTLNHIVD